MELNLTVYTGSSLPPDDRSRLAGRADACGVRLAFRPPIVRGDLLDSPGGDPARHRVLMIDGHFGQDLSVSVTEIRAYLERGNHLSGAASMGALRAVECRTLGMVPHGWIARHYLTGAMEADADVALLMDPETFEAVTVPLANVRWLLEECQESGAITPGTGRTALETADRIHYTARMPEALATAWRRTLPEPEGDLLARRLLPEELPAWDRKRLDAVEAVETELAELAAVGGR